MNKSVSTMFEFCYFYFFFHVTMSGVTHFICTVNCKPSFQHGSDLDTVRSNVDHSARLNLVIFDFRIYRSVALVSVVNRYLNFFTPICNSQIIIKLMTCLWYFQKQAYCNHHVIRYSDCVEPFTVQNCNKIDYCIIN